MYANVKAMGETVCTCHIPALVITIYIGPVRQVVPVLAVLLSVYLTLNFFVQAYIYSVFVFKTYSKNSLKRD